MEHKEPKYELLDVGLLVPTPDNPRTIHEHSESFAELLASVKAEGVKIPVVVRPHPDQKGKYDLRAGARRKLAAQKAKLKVIPALVYDPMTDEEAFDITFLENFAREDLNPIEEAKAVAILSLQFIPIEYRQQILQKIHDHTIPGGAFIFVEKVLGQSAKIDEVMKKVYYDLKRENGYSQDSIDRKRLSLEGVLVPVTAGFNETLLAEAGFRYVDCFWRWMNFAGWLAVRE